MNRQEFMFQLAGELVNIPAEERISALKYYEEYFEDAGPENEQKVLEELGTPQEVARQILEDYNQREPGQDAYYSAPPPVYSIPAQTPPAQNRRSPWVRVLIAVLVIIFCWPLVIAVVGVLIGLLGAVLGLAIGLLGAFIGLLVGGIFGVVRGILALFTVPAVGLMQIGGGLISVGLGLFFSIMAVWLVLAVMPRFVRWLVSLVRRVFGIDKGGAK